MVDPDRVLECAREIRYFLPELMGDRAAAVDGELSMLLQQAKSEPTHDQILEVLKRDSNTRNWAAEFLSLEQISKGFQSLPGRGGAIAAAKYVCPGGDYVWYRRSVGVGIPACPTHGDLVPVNEV